MSYDADKLGDWRTDAGNENTQRPILALGNETGVLFPFHNQYPYINNTLAVHLYAETRIANAFFVHD